MSTRLKISGPYPAWGPEVREGNLVRPDGNAERVLVWVSPDQPSTPENLTRLREDAALLSRIRHENVMRVEHVTALGGKAAQVYPFSELASLGRVLDACRQKGLFLPTRAVVEIAAAVATALDTATTLTSVGGGRKVIHPGPTPSDVLVDVLGRVRLSGLRVLAPLDALPRIPSGYSPPEGPGSFEGSSYGTGALMLALLTAESPPDTHGDPARHEAGLRKAMIRVLARPGEPVGENLLKLIRVMMGLDPRGRPTLTVLARRLRELASSLHSNGLRTWAPAAIPGILKWKGDTIPNLSDMVTTAAREPGPASPVRAARPSPTRTGEPEQPKGPPTQRFSSFPQLMRADPPTEDDANPTDALGFMVRPETSDDYTQERTTVDPRFDSASSSRPLPPIPDPVTAVSRPPLKPPFPPPPVALASPSGASPEPLDDRLLSTPVSLDPEQVTQEPLPTDRRIQVPFQGTPSPISRPVPPPPPGKGPSPKPQVLPPPPGSPPATPRPAPPPLRPQPSAPSVPPPVLSMAPPPPRSPSLAIASAAVQSRLTIDQELLDAETYEVERPRPKARWPLYLLVGVLALILVLTGALAFWPSRSGNPSPFRVPYGSPGPDLSAILNPDAPSMVATPPENQAPPSEKEQRPSTAPNPGAPSSAEKLPEHGETVAEPSHDTPQAGSSTEPAGTPSAPSSGAPTTDAPPSFRVSFSSSDPEVQDIDVLCNQGSGGGPSPVVINDAGKGPCRVTFVLPSSKVVLSVALKGPRDYRCDPARRICE